MTTARELVTDALIDLGEFDPTETIDAADLVRGIRVLNRMLSLWSVQNLLAPYTISESFAGSGSASYTMGTAGTASATRAKTILNAYANDGSNDTPIEIIDQRKYNNIPDKSTAGTPEFLFYDPIYPVGVIYLYRVPSASYTIHIESTKELTGTLAIATTLLLPPEYEEAIVTNLTIRLAPSYKVQITPFMYQAASDSLKPIRNLNAANRLEEMSMPAMPITNGGRRYNILSDV